MAIESLPAWPFEPNWSTSLTEVLEWLTDVMTSPSGSEQRRSLRYYPRRTFDFSIVADGDERSLLDNMLVTYGALRWHLPLWFDANFSTAAVAAGASTIGCLTAETSRMRDGGLAYLVGADVYDFEIVEIATIDSTTITLAAPTVRAWPAATRIHPVCVAQLTDQPSLSTRSDRLITTEVRFRMLEAGTAPTGTFDPDTYLTFAVLAMAPDRRVPLSADYERMLVEIDNMTSIPRQVDSAGRPFPLQQYAWVLEGRAQHNEFEALLQHLRGRAIPIWMPTFMEDFVLAEAIVDGADSILVERAGFALAGGPRWDRQDIMIETDSEKIYRRITDVAVDSEGREILVLDTPIVGDFALTSVVRICFMALVRLNQDNIEIEHHTDTEGVSTVLATFRSAPDTRLPLPSF